MKISEHPQDGKAMTLGDVRRLVNRADVLEIDDTARVTFKYGRKSQAREIFIEDVLNTFEGL